MRKSTLRDGAWRRIIVQWIVEMLRRREMGF